MHKKIFFTDLDETLLTTTKEITPATMDAVCRLTEAGHYLVLISGRPMDSITETRKALGIPDRNLYYVSDNGGRIMDAKGDKILYEKRLAMEEAKYLLEYCRQAGIHAHAYTDTSIVAFHPSEELDFYRRTIHLPVEYRDDIVASLQKPPFKCLAITLKGRHLLYKLKDELTSWAEGKVNLICSTDRLLEMFPLTSGKGSALIWLADYLQIPLQDTLSAGDQDNDASMLEAAGFGLAMCNGSQAAKKAANAVTLQDNNHDGLVPFLQDFFLLHR